MSVSTTATARNAIDAAIEALMTRRRTTSDAAEKATINDSIIELQNERDALDAADLNAAAGAVASAQAALTECVAAARVGPFDSYLASLHTAIIALQGAQADATDPPAALLPPPAGPEALTGSGRPPPDIQPLPSAATAPPATSPISLSPTQPVGPVAGVALRRGSFAIDTFAPSEQSLLDAFKASCGGAAPTFWGRYFHAPGQINSSGKFDPGHYSSVENKLLHANGIRVLPIARQTSHVGGSAQDGANDAARNVDALFEVFPATYLSGADPNVLIFLDAELDPKKQPSLSPDYYIGWSSTLIRLGAERSSGRAQLHPALYASHGDTATWSALRAALASRAICDGVWVASWKTTPTPLDWDGSSTTPVGGLTCPILAWQYFGGTGPNFDADQTNPMHTDMLISRLVMPPAAASS